MTLKDKFENIDIEMNDEEGTWFGSITEKEAEQFEKIADDYAIEFKNWCDKIIIEEWIDKTTNELLEIFKNK